MDPCLQYGFEDCGEIIMSMCIAVLYNQAKRQGQILATEEYVKEHKLAGLTLCTNKYAPAPDFYRKNGFWDNEIIMFMYKESR